MQDFSEYLDFTKELAISSGKILSKHFGNIKSINQKSTNIDLVTNADLESEAFIVKTFRRIERTKIGGVLFGWIRNKYF